MSKRSTILILFLFLAAPLSFILSGLAVWEYAGLNGETPWSAAWLIWQRGSPQLKTWLLNGSLIFFGLFLMLLLLFLGKWHMRQRRMMYGQTRLATLRDVRQAGLLGNSGLFFGYFNGRPLFDATQLHVLLVAESGTGKGVSLIIPNLLLWNGSVICTDMKGENYRYTSGYRASRGQSCYCFDPFSQDTHCINPLAYFDDENPIDHFQRMGYVIYPDNGKAEKIWVSNARQLFIGLALLLYLEQGRHAVTFANIIATHTGLDLDNLDARLQKLTGNEYLINSCRQILKNHAGTPDKTRGGFDAEFRAPLDVFLNPSVAWATSKNDVPLDKLRKAPITLYLNTTPGNIDRVSFLMRMILETVNMLHTQEEFRANPEHRYQLLLLNDEQHNFYGNLPLMGKAASFYRSYGIRIFSVYQSVAQIKQDYGNDGARAYMDNHNIRIHYCPTDLKKAKEFAAELGETTIFTKSRSTGKGGSHTGTSEAPQKREAFLPEELINMLGQTHGLLFVGSSRPIRFRKAVWYEEESFKSRQLPPIKLPHTDSRAAEAFLNRTLTVLIPESPSLDTLSEMVKNGASDEEINKMIDQIILKPTN